MEDVSNIGKGLSFVGSTLTRFSPEPRSRSKSTFAGILKNIGAAASDLASSVTGGIDPIYMDLINQQIQAQQQMQLVSFISNIEKSKHETQMAAIRNVRVG